MLGFLVLKDYLVEMEMAVESNRMGVEREELRSEHTSGSGDQSAHRASLVAQMVKNLPGMWRWILGWGRSLGERNDYPLQYSCWENPMDRGAWWATVHGVTNSRT